MSNNTTIDDVLNTACDVTVVSRHYVAADNPAQSQERPVYPRQSSTGLRRAGAERIGRDAADSAAGRCAHGPAPGKVGGPETEGETVTQSVM